MTADTLIVDNEASYRGVLKAPSTDTMGVSIVWYCPHGHPTMTTANRCALDEKDRRLQAEAHRDRVRITAGGNDLLLERLVNRKPYAVRLTAIPAEDATEPPAEIELTASSVKDLIEGLKEVTNAT